MRSWLKHRNDKLERSVHGKNKEVLITTVSRHRNCGGGTDRHLWPGYGLAGGVAAGETTIPALLR